jgi:hypothetical protein
MQDCHLLKGQKVFPPTWLPSSCVFKLFVDPMHVQLARVSSIAKAIQEDVYNHAAVSLSSIAKAIPYRSHL